jgi:hypothetical protein
VSIVHLVKVALITTVMVLVTIYVLNRIQFTRNLIQTAFS